MSYCLNRQYKLLVIDIDGTLLNDQNQITQKTIDAIKQFKQLGLAITLATGRIYSDAFYFAKYLNLFSPMILLHGALIQTYSGKFLKKKTLSPNVVAKLIKIAREKKASFQAFQTDSLFIEEQNKWNDLYLKYSYKKPKIVYVADMLHYLENEFNQFAFLGEKSKILQLKKLVEEQLPNSVSIACSHSNLLEIVALGVSKGNALKELAKIINIPLSEIIAIGDNYNDIEMIQIAGLGVAMGNAPKKVKNAADFITKDNNHDGIACFATRFLTWHNQ